MARAVALLEGHHLKQQQFLCLPPATGELPETGGVIVSSPACPIRKQIEHAGHIYQKKLIRAYSLNAPTSDDESSASQPSDSSATPSRQTYRTTSVDAASALRSKIAVGSDDLYELLELGDKRWHATADDIKKNFRRISLTYHPDKVSHVGEEARANSESHFKAVMKAYDILSDKKKRAAYDSIDDVDDSIPSERDATTSPDRFYEKFASCFALNARWSMSDRVPKFGDDSTDIEIVEKFYNFWYSFKSWRDFSFDLEHDTDQAECREEKRWMERQNSKHVKTKKLEENTRIRKLVDLAYKHDPRLNRVKAAVKAKKDAKKLEKKKRVEEQVREEQEHKQRQEAEAAQKEADDKVKRAEVKKEKEKAKQIMRKARQKLRGHGRELHLESSERGNFMIEKLCMEGSVDSIEAAAHLLSTLDISCDNSNAMALELIGRAVKNPQQPLSTDEGTNGSSHTDLASKVGFTDITQPETPKVKERINAKPAPVGNGVTHATADVSSTSKKNNETKWTADELSLLSKGVAKFPGGTRDRWERLALLIGTKTADEVLRKVNESRKPKAKATALTTSSGKKNDVKGSTRVQEKKKGAPAVPQEQPKATANGTTPRAGGAGQPPNSLQFTPKEQAVFEDALKKFPSTSGDGRWKMVAGAVGRNAGDCQQRFNELIMFYKSRKQAK